jgi:hypothetical protein
MRWRRIIRCSSKCLCAAIRVHILWTPTRCPTGRCTRPMQMLASYVDARGQPCLCVSYQYVYFVYTRQFGWTAASLFLQRQRHSFSSVSVAAIAMWSDGSSWFG